MSDNTAQIEYWNGNGGSTWVRAQERMDEMLSGLSAATIDFAAVKAGERVIDVGCGCGATSIALAQAGASVWGIDISEPMLARARERAPGKGALYFSKADASIADFTADHQLVFSRFGVMFFADPVAAFTNLKTALVPGGRLVFLCWRVAAANPWIAVAGRAVQPFLSAPETPPDPKAPGPFAFADENYVSEILSQSGFHNIQISPLDGELRLGGTVDDALAFQGEIGPLSRVLAELDEQRRGEALAAAKAALMPFVSERGVSLAAACWLVSASA